MIHSRKIDGEPWVAEIRFWGITDPNGRIRSIGLNAAVGSPSEADCMGRAARVIAKLFTKDGARILASAGRGASGTQRTPVALCLPPERAAKSGF